MANMKNFAGINLKLRAKNPQFWFQIGLAIAAPIAGYTGLTGADISSWSLLFGTLWDAVSNPYLLMLIAVSVYNATIDSTVRGFSDSEQMLQRDTPIANKNQEVVVYEAPAEKPEDTPEATMEDIMNETEEEEKLKK